MSTIYVRSALGSDVPFIIQIIDEAKNNLKEQEIDQWQSGYPSLGNISNDVRNDFGYVLVENGNIIGYLAVLVGEEKAYTEITDGSWYNDSIAYAAIHRFAIRANYQGKGLAGRFLSSIFTIYNDRQINDFRTDTHPKNERMIKMLEKNGFEKRGTVQNEGERIAFQTVLN